MKTLIISIGNSIFRWLLNLDTNNICVNSIFWLFSRRTNLQNTNVTLLRYMSVYTIVCEHLPILLSRWWNINIIFVYLLLHKQSECISKWLWNSKMFTRSNYLRRYRSIRTRFQVNIPRYTVYILQCPEHIDSCSRTWYQKRVVVGCPGSDRYNCIFPAGSWRPSTIRILDQCQKIFLGGYWEF